MAHQRQKVILPGGTIYWTVVDDRFERVADLDAYLRYIRIAEGRAESTTRQYASALAALATWGVDRALGYDLRAWAEDLTEFKMHLMVTPVHRPGAGQGRPRGDDRIDAIFAAIRSFYKWAVRRKKVAREVNDLLYEVVRARGAAVGWMEDPPAEILSPLHRTGARGQSDPKRVVVSEVEAMLAAPGLLRDKLLVVLLALEAVRIEEAVTFRRSHFHFMENSRSLGCHRPGPHLHVTGKGNKSAPIPANPYLLTVYSLYQVEREQMSSAARQSDYVLINIKGGEIGAPITTGRGRKIVSALARRAGIERHVTPHQFRHGLATELLDRGRSLDEVQRLLRHSHLDTTRRYAATSDRRLREAVESVPPPRAVL